MTVLEARPWFNFGKERLPSVASAKSQLEPVYWS